MRISERRYGPLSESEKQIIQESVDQIYTTFTKELPPVEK